MLSLNITYFVLIMARSMTSEWDRCQHENLPQIPRVPYHMTFGSGLPGTNGQKRAIPDASPADLQDSLSPIFQLAPGQMSTGNFCALLQPGHGSLQPPSPTQYTRAVEEGEEALHCQHPFPPQNNQEKNSMDVWCNGEIIESAGEFVDDGTETHFSVGSHDCYIKAVSSGKRREGIIHTLIVDNREIPESLQ
nr:dnaJ homolog subfamily C member 14 isoform X1 [Peromyscus maniculatus bairdii]